MTTELPPLKTRKPHDSSKIIIAGLGALVVVILSFIAGMQFQKGKASKTVVNARGNVTFNGRRGGQRNGVIGTVSAVSATSITVQDTRTQTAKTLSVDSTTTITNNGTTAAITDIKVGDTVIVTADTTDATKAARVVLNPQAGGGFGPGGAAPTSSDSQPL
jgi:hypothetical protein